MLSRDFAHGVVQESQLEQVTIRSLTLAGFALSVGDFCTRTETPVHKFTRWLGIDACSTADQANRLESLPVAGCCFGGCRSRRHRRGRLVTVAARLRRRRLRGGRFNFGLTAELAHV